MGRIETLIGQNGNFSGECDGGAVHWMPHRVIQCAKAIGMTMEGTSGGWNSLVEFAQSRERENQKEMRHRKFKRKGGRELNSLSCSINYDKSKAKEAVGKDLNTIGEICRELL